MTETSANNNSDLLIVLAEDNDADAFMIERVLSDLQLPGHVLERTSTLEETLAMIAKAAPEVILLDMNLGDSNGIDTVHAVHAASGDAAIIVLTGIRKGELAYEAIDAGAQDFLGKDEITERNLRRILSFAISRRKIHLRRLEEALASERALTAKQSDIRAKSTSLHVDNTELYESTLKRYTEMLKVYLDSLVLNRAKPEIDMKDLVAQLGAAGAGPNDIMDIHVKALEEATRNVRPERAFYLNTDGRLLALEVMGHLVSFYRSANKTAAETAHKTS